MEEEAEGGGGGDESLPELSLHGAPYEGLEVGACGSVKIGSELSIGVGG